MLYLPRKYFLIAAKSWGRAISGPILGLAGLALLTAQQAITDSPKAVIIVRDCGWGVLWIAALMVFVAQYEVWKEEHDARHAAEEELNKEACVQGLVSLYFQDNPYGIGYRFDCVNRGRKPCEISIVMIAMELPDGIRDRFIRLSDSDVKMLHHGQRFGLSGGLSIPETTIPRETLKEVPISVYLVDSLGVEYRDITTFKYFN